MKIYVIHATAFDFRNELYKPLKDSQLSREHEFILPHEATEKKSKKLIEEADLVLAEVSYPSTGSGIELGWANAFDKPILCAHKTETKPSSAVKFVASDIIAYQDAEHFISVLSERLKDFCRAAPACRS